MKIVISLQLAYIYIIIYLYIYIHTNPGRPLLQPFRSSERLLVLCRLCDGADIADGAVGRRATAGCEDEGGGQTNLTVDSPSTHVTHSVRDDLKQYKAVIDSHNIMS